MVMTDERHHGSVPNPDPTILTTEALHREIDLLERYLTTKLSDATMIIGARLDAMDKAAELLHRNLLNTPEEMAKRVSQLQQLYDEKFNSIHRQFSERDVRTEQAAIATKIAVDAALQAQKEAAGAQNEANAAAITKSEAATVKQIDGIQALISGSSAATNDRIADLKSRLDRGEGVIRGGSDTWTVVLAVISTGIAVFAAMVSLFIALHNTSTTTKVSAADPPGVPLAIAQRSPHMPFA